MVEGMDGGTDVLSSLSHCAMRHPPAAHRLRNSSLQWGGQTEINSADEWFLSRLIADFWQKLNTVFTDFYTLFGEHWDCSRTRKCSIEPYSWLKKKEWRAFYSDKVRDPQVGENLMFSWSRKKSRFTKRLKECPRVLMCYTGVSREEKWESVFPCLSSPLCFVLLAVQSWKATLQGCSNTPHSRGKVCHP